MVAGCNRSCKFDAVFFIVLKSGNVKKVLFVDDTHPVLWDELLEMGFQCDDFSGITAGECKLIIGDYFGAVIRSKITFDAEM